MQYPMNQMSSKKASSSIESKSRTVEAGLSSPAAIRNKAVMNFLRQNSSQTTHSISGTSSTNRINIVTESCSFIPGSFPSTFSLKKFLGPETQSTEEEKHLGDLGQAASVSLNLLLIIFESILKFK